MSDLIKVGITHGDVNGVGYEILIKAFTDARLLELFQPIITVHQNRHRITGKYWITTASIFTPSTVPKKRGGKNKFGEQR